MLRLHNQWLYSLTIKQSLPHPEPELNCRLCSRKRYNTAWGSLPNPLKTNKRNKRQKSPPPTSGITWTEHCNWLILLEKKFVNDFKLLHCEVTAAAKSLILLYKRFVNDFNGLHSTVESHCKSLIPHSRYSQASLRCFCRKRTDPEPEEMGVSHWNLGQNQWNRPW